MVSGWIFGKRTQIAYLTFCYNGFMEIWQSVKFTLKASWEVSKKLLILYFSLQTILALTFIIDLLSYKEIIDTINHTKTILGLSIFEDPQNVGLANRAFNRFQFQFKYYLKAIIDVYTGLIKLLISLSIFFFVSPIIGTFVILANFIQIYINSKQAYGVFLIYRADSEVKRKFEYIVNTLFSKDTLPEIKLYQAFGFFKDKVLRVYRQFTNRQLKVEKKRLTYYTLAGFLPTFSIFIYSLFIANQ